MAFLGWMVQVVGWLLFVMGLRLNIKATREARQRPSQLQLQNNMILMGLFHPLIVVLMLRHTVPGKVASAVTILMAIRLLWVSRRAWNQNKAAESAVVANDASNRP